MKKLFRSKKMKFVRTENFRFKFYLTIYFVQFFLYPEKFELFFVLFNCKQALVKALLLVVLKVKIYQ